MSRINLTTSTDSDYHSQNDTAPSRYEKHQSGSSIEPTTSNEIGMNAVQIPTAKMNHPTNNKRKRNHDKDNDVTPAQNPNKKSKLTYESNEVQHFPCVRCDFIAKNRAGLKKHMHAHETECEICINQFETKEELYEHTETNHGIKLEFTCSVCSDRFPEKTECESHENACERKYQCNVCPRKFDQKINLKQHLHTHTGLKRYACSYCHRRFSFSGNLKVHMKNKHRAKYNTSLN